MKAEKIRAFIKYSFPRHIALPTLDTEMTRVYVENLTKELDELERLAKIGKEIEKASAWYPIL